MSVEVEKSRRPGLTALAKLADVVFYSRSWAMAEGYTSARECLEIQAQETGANSLFGTWGERPSAVLSKQHGTVVEAWPRSPDDMKVIDAVGAGDTFIAGILYRLCLDPSLDTPQKCEDILNFANGLAVLKIGREGFSGLANNVLHLP